MSRAKEVQILIVDVNPSMGGDFKTAKEAMLMHVQQKIIQAPKTEMGLVCVGTEGEFFQVLFGSVCLPACMRWCIFPEFSSSVCEAEKVT